MASSTPAAVPALREAEFRDFQAFILDAAGITLSAAKRTLVASRLAGRVKRLGCSDYGDYFRRLKSDADERRTAVDLLTTNETYFFREPAHFDYLEKQLLPAHPRGTPLRTWSAACSSGEEPYSLAMLFHARLGDAPWQITASDISSQVLARARRAVYPMARAQRIPQEWLERYCRRGTGEHEGLFLVDKRLRERVEFRSVNLNEALPRIGPFDLVVLRNVLIYFSPETKARVLERIVERVVPGGHLFTGHSESLGTETFGLRRVAPSIYRKPS